MGFKPILKEALPFFMDILLYSGHMLPFFSISSLFVSILTENSETIIQLRVLKLVRAFASGMYQRTGLFFFITFCCLAQASSPCSCPPVSNAIVHLTLSRNLKNFVRICGFCPCLDYLIFRCCTALCSNV